MKYTNIKLIMDKLTRHPLLLDIPFETVVDYAVDFIRIVGCPPLFDEKVEVVHIEDYRGELPCDFYLMIQVRPAYQGEHAFRYSTDSFHYSKHKPDMSDLTYKLKGNVIFTSLKEGDIEVAYKAMMVDEEGYPLIPDNSTFSRALEAYIKKQWFTILFDLGKINGNVIAKADQDYAWAVGQCHADLVMPTIDQMEAITNMWNNIVVRAGEHRHGFLHTGTQEHVKIHR